MVCAAIEAGIFNDLGSGSNVDVTVITKGNVEYMRNHKTPNERGIKEKSYKFQSGTTGMQVVAEGVATLVISSHDIPNWFNEISYFP